MSHEHKAGSALPTKSFALCMTQDMALLTYYQTFNKVYEVTQGTETTDL